MRFFSGLFIPRPTGEGAGVSMKVTVIRAAPRSTALNKHDAVLSLEESLAVFFACSLIIFVAIIVCYLVRRYLKEQQEALGRHVMEERLATQRQRRQDVDISVALTTQLASRLQTIGPSGHQVHQCSSAPNDDHKDLACHRSQEVSKNKRGLQTSSQCLGHHIYRTSPPACPIFASPQPPYGQKQQNDINLCPEMFCPEVYDEPDLMEPELMQKSLRYLQPDDINKKPFRVKVQSSLTSQRFSTHTNSTAVLTSHDNSAKNLDISIKGPSKQPMLLCSAHSMASCDLNLWPSTTIPFSPSEEEKPIHHNFRLKSSSASPPFDSFSLQSGTLSSFPGHTPEVIQCQSSLSQLSVCVLPSYTNSQRSFSTSSDNGNNCDPSPNQSCEKSCNLGPIAPARTLFKSPDPGEFSFNSNESVFYTGTIT